MTPRKKDHSLDETVKLERVLLDKERVKFWVLIISLLAGLIGTTQSTMLWGDGSKNKEDMGILVEQLNNTVLPQIQKELELLRADNIVLHERLATISICNELYKDIQKEMKLPVTGGKGKENREAQEAALIKLQPPEELFKARPAMKLSLDKLEE
jgi:hypothetical protein